MGFADPVDDPVAVDDHRRAAGRRLPHDLQEHVVLIRVPHLGQLPVDVHRDVMAVVVQLDVIAAVTTALAHRVDPAQAGAEHLRRREHQTVGAGR